MKEAAVQNHIRLDAAYRGVELWRNNTGVLFDETGRPVRYGLANDSSKLNKEIKSSDLIGITPIIITADMVGKVVGVFTAIECKPDGWTYSERDERAVAQKRFHDIVLKNGAYAGFARNIQEYRKIIGHETR